MNVIPKPNKVRDTEPLDLNDVDWKKVEASVRRLQKRIEKARQDGRFGKAGSLERILAKSFAAKALATKNTMQSSV